MSHRNAQGGFNPFMFSGAIRGCFVQHIALSHPAHSCTLIQPLKAPLGVS